MYSNNHATRLALLISENEQLLSNIRGTQANLGWFEEFDNEWAHSALSQLKRDMHAAREQLGQLDKAIKSNSAQLASARALAAPGFFGRFYKSTERSVAALQVATLEGRLNELRSNEATVKSEFEQDERSEQRLAADLERYRGFDPLEAQAALAQFAAKLQHLQANIEQTRNASERWEAAAGVAAREYKSAMSEIQNLARDIRDAEKFERALTAAASGTSRERAVIHDDCERRFGVGRGKPGHVLRDARAAQRKRSRDVEKLEIRLRDIIRLLDNEIKTLILDGNNLCNATAENGQRRYIGLDALKALVPHLCLTYKVTLVFDPGIRRLAQMNDRDLQASFPNARVEVMRSKNKADETILGAAEFDKSAYVISNDGFGEYRDKAAVREGRVLSYVTHPQSVQIVQLQLNLEYRRESASQC